MLTLQRFQIEKQVLERFFPRRFAFWQMDSDNPFVDIGLRTNSGNIYRIRILLYNFPHDVPPVYLIHPKPLRDYSGRKLHSYKVNATMHLLTPDKEGHIQLCHYISSNWHSNVTLYKVSLKALIWINAYEGHTRTGLPIDHYLSHQKIH